MNTSVSINSSSLISYAIVCSLLVHISVVAVGALWIGQANDNTLPNTLKVRINAAPEVIPEKPKEVVSRPEKKPEQRLEKKPPVPSAKKIQGLTKESVSDALGAGLAAPMGNSLMIEDQGKRLSADEVATLKRDLTSSALLIQGSFKTPDYTQAALDANLEGQYIVDVYVDDKGNVRQAELRKKIGYGMDEHVLQVANSSRFIPAKDEKGVPKAEWAEIKFLLEIP